MDSDQERRIFAGLSLEASRIYELEQLLDFERLQRIAAQRGLVPYVRSLEAFSRWLGKRPSLRKQLEPKMRELGLWNIRLGYDPDQDLILSAASPHKR